jgi:hypothetical protein
MATPTNTRLRYSYTDADGETVSSGLVLAGPLEAEQVATIFGSQGEDGFVPQAVGLLALQETDRDWDEDRDHAWHRLLRIEATVAEPTIGTTAREFAARWSEASADWEAEAASAVPVFRPKV